MKDLGKLEGSDVTRALAINKSGQVAGFSAWTNFRHAFLYDDGVMKDIHTIGVSSDARGINDKGQIVGSASLQTNDRERTAFLYTDGVMMELRSLLEFDEGWDLIWAFDINNQGQIVGQGILNGETHAFLMTPTQKPHCSNKPHHDNESHHADKSRHDKESHHVDKPHHVNKPHHAAPLKEWVGGIGGYWEDEDLGSSSRIDSVTDGRGNPPFLFPQSWTSPDFVDNHQAGKICFAYNMPFRYVQKNPLESLIAGSPL